jgi:hypothetical protein
MGCIRDDEFVSAVSKWNSQNEIPDNEKFLTTWKLFHLSPYNFLLVMFLNSSQEHKQMNYFLWFTCSLVS